jgi:hypothetical protein
LAVLLTPWLLLYPFDLVAGVNGPAAPAQRVAQHDSDTRTMKVIVLNYDPILRQHGSVRLRQFMKWNDPRLLTTNLVRHLREVSRGFADYQIADFINVDAFPVKRDGFRYDEASFLEMWQDRNKAHQPDSVSYAAIFKQFDLVRRVQREGISEVWLWGAPYFGTDEYAMKIPGDRVFYPTDNPWFYRPYDIPDCGRTVWVMGFNYEVGEDNALHSYGHRVEGILSLTVGRGVWDHKKNPTSIWNRFTRQAAEFPDDAQVGNVHGGPNARGGYDYAQTNAVLSGADDWFNYPHLTGAKKLVDHQTWGGPQYHLNYMRWWLDHMPKARGVTDGFYNNWWRYIVDYDDAVKKLPPPEGRPHKAKTEVARRLLPVIKPGLTKLCRICDKVL